MDNLQAHYCKTYDGECICETCECDVMGRPVCKTCKEFKGMMLD